MKREFLGASLLYVALTVVLAYPLSFHPADRLLWMGADSELFAWTLAWNAHALLHQPLSIFDANIFHPQSLTLAYTENLVGSSLISAPVLWFTGNPVLAINLVALASCALCGLGAHLLARRLGLGPAAATLAGIVFAFSPPRFGRLGQIHLTTVQWLPFALAFFHGYLDQGRRRDLRLAVGFLTLQAWTSGHGAVFLLMAMAALAAWRLVLGERIAIARRARDLGLIGLLLLGALILLVLPYRAVQQQIGLRRPLDPAWWTDWLHPALSYIASPAHVPRFIASRFVSVDVIDSASAYLFPGILPLLLALVAILRPRRDSAGVEASRLPDGVRSRRWMRALMLGLASIGVAALALAACVAFNGRVAVTVAGVRMKASDPWRALLIGTTLVTAALALSWRLRLLPPQPGFLSRRVEAWQSFSRRHRANALLFYALLALVTLWLSAGAPIGPWPWLYSLPGFNFMRVPARFTVLTLLALAIVAAFGFERLFGSAAGGRRRAAAVLCGALMVAEFAMVPLATVPYRLEIPEVDRWLNTQPKPFTVAEVPFSTERDQTTYMMHSTAHWQRTLNGYSGFRPPLHEAVFPIVRTFPSAESIDALRRLGVTYVVVHPEAYRHGQWPAVREALSKAEDVEITLVHTDGQARVYTLRARQ